MAKKQILFQRISHRFAEIVEDWPEDKRLWIHLHGTAESGVHDLLEILGAQLAKKYTHLFHLDALIADLRQSAAMREFVHEAVLSNDEQFRKFVQRFPRHIRQVFTDWPEAHGRWDRWDSYLFTQLLQNMAEPSPGSITIRHADQIASQSGSYLLQILARCADIPLIVLSSGEHELDASDDRHVHNLHLTKLSIREAERLIARELDRTAISARLITNHLYVKSRGQYLRLRFMLAAYYTRFQGSDAPIDSKTLEEIRPASTKEGIYQSLLKVLPERVVDLLAFMCRLDDPLPQELFSALCKSLELPSHWEDSAIFTRHSHAGRPFTTIGWQPWRDFLRGSTALERCAPVLKQLKPLIGSIDSHLPLELSSLFFDDGDAQTALPLAIEEAGVLERFGLTKRALDRLSFVRRNFERTSSPSVDLSKLLDRIAGLQIRIGIYQNAFETYREKRERLRRDQRQEWLNTSLQMAETLLRMDAFTEVRYLIKELKFKEDSSPYVVAYANLLMGQLEQNSGHPDYALRYYNAALDMAAAAADDELIYRIYATLHRAFGETGEAAATEDLCRKVTEMLGSNSVHRTTVYLDLIRLYLKQHDYHAALPIARLLFRHPGAVASPGDHLMLNLYLAEIYGYHGKWYLSRSYLLRLRRSPIFSPNERTVVDLLTQLAVVEKEIGRFGPAMALLKDALDLATSAGLVRHQHNIGLHLGHIYLLVHSPMRAREYLLKTLRWSEEQQDVEFLIQSSLFLSSYELQQGRHASAQQYLETAQEHIAIEGGKLDQLNWLYYRIQFEFSTGRPADARALLKSLQLDNPGICKFEILHTWMNAKLEMAEGAYEVAKPLFLEALQMSRQVKMPLLVFQILRDLAEMMHRSGDESSFKIYLAEAQTAFERLQHAITDQILQRQLKESREYEELAALDQYT